MSDEDDAPDWAKKEVQEAIRILKEDGVHIHKTYKQFMDSQAGETVNKAAAAGEKLANVGDKLGGGDTEGSPPPEKPEEKQEKPKKKGMWWGDRSE